MSTGRRRQTGRPACGHVENAKRYPPEGARVVIAFSVALR